MTCKEQMLRWLKSLGPAGRSRLYGPSCTLTPGHSPTSGEHATSSRSFGQERGLETPHTPFFWSEIKKMRRENQLFSHPIGSSTLCTHRSRGPAPSGLREVGQGEGLHHTGTLFPGLHTPPPFPPYRTTSRYFGPDFAGIWHSSLIGHTIPYGI